MSEIDDLLAEYRGVRARLSQVVQEDADLLDAPVAACPAWTARDVVSHLVGLAEDLVAGRLEGYGSEAWTAGHVARLKGVPLEEALGRWGDAASRLDTVAPIAGVPAGAMAFGDALVHEADVRGTVAPGTRAPAVAIAHGLKAAISRWRPVLERAGAPTLRVDVIGRREYLLGRDADPVAVLHADQYELFRALFGRRSREQVRALEWDGDCRPYLDAGLPEPFRWAELDLVD